MNEFLAEITDLRQSREKTLSSLENKERELEMMASERENVIEQMSTEKAGLESRLTEVQMNLRQFQSELEELRRGREEAEKEKKRMDLEMATLRDEKQQVEELILMQKRGHEDQTMAMAAEREKLTKELEGVRQGRRVLENLLGENSIAISKMKEGRWS